MGGIVPNVVIISLFGLFFYRYPLKIKIYTKFVLLGIHFSLGV